VREENQGGHRERGIWFLGTFWSRDRNWKYFVVCCAITSNII
jgi:hypothetical protein